MFTGVSVVRWFGVSDSTKNCTIFDGAFLVESLLMHRVCLGNEDSVFERGWAEGVFGFGD